MSFVEEMTINVVPCVLWGFLKFLCMVTYCIEIQIIYETNVRFSVCFV